MMGWYGGMGWGGWIFDGLLMLAFWSLLVFGGIALFRGLGRDERGRNGRDDALRLLDERFARGEIDAEEYTTRRDLLRSGR